MSGLILNDPLLCRSSAYWNGQWQQPAAGAEYTVLDPASRDTLLTVSDCGAEDADQAIQSARHALPAWSGLTAKARAEILHRWYLLIEQHSDDLALLMTSEQGKPLAEARGEIAYAASFVQWFAEEAKRAYGDVIPSPWEDARILVLRQPIGVVAAIVPWNFPAAMITRKAAPALAAGCTFVVKPSEETPLTALALAELAERAGIPAGVFNVVPSNQAAAVGERFTKHPDVAMVSFTGSTEVGRILQRQSADTVKKLGLELGGNAPFIVFDDADIDAAIEGLIVSKFRNAGQTCVCANRIMVQSGIYTEFTERLLAACQKLVVANGRAENASIGPLINTQGHQKVSALVQSALAAGAKAAFVGDLNGQDPEVFYPATLLTDVSLDMEVCRQEIFGPVAPLIRFDTEQQAIQWANDTPMGLAAYFYSREIGRIWRVQEALEYGIVAVNAGLISTEVAPFGGVKQSGLGREGSKYGLDEFLEMKYVLQSGL